MYISMNNTQVTKVGTMKALILNELTLHCATEQEHIDYAYRIGKELGNDIDKMVGSYSYLTKWANRNFGAKALPTLAAQT